jgi:nucleoside-diphosphate-sugar epimerase
MRALITGEKGFIGTNLPRSLSKYNISSFNPNLDDTKKELFEEIGTKYTDTNEICVHLNNENLWEKIFDSQKIDIVIHNAAVVGTDVVALKPSEATLTNVTGTYNIIRAANKCNIPVVYLGTTVIYDAKLYQELHIKEDSVRGPHTYYGHLKVTAEEMVKSFANKWMIIRPLFAYGGVGDMNSLIAKTFYASKENEKINMFLDPNKIKDYLHVEDFCDAVALAIFKDLFQDDFNIAAETPIITQEIITSMSDIAGKDLNPLIKWHPKTDYLGNHRLSRKKFTSYTDWQPSISLLDGLRRSYESITSERDSNYNPLIYLQEAENQNIDLTKYY